MTPFIKEVKIIDNHHLEILYEGNEKRIFDISPYFDNGRFKELENFEIFSKVRISFDTLEWENGIDIDPDTLYLKSMQIA